MDEYIKREAAIKSLLNDSTEQVGYSREDAADCIRYMDAADVAPVRHGRWKPYHEADIGYDEYGVRCSNCKFEVEDHEVNFIMKYCPNCGADMRGSNDE